MLLNLGILELLCVLLACYLIFGKKQMANMGKKAGRKFMKVKELSDGLTHELDEVKGIITSRPKDNLEKK